MSSEENVLDNIAVPAKKRRIQRACDACRQKRRACDGLRTSTKKCSYCSDNGLECVYSGAPATTQRPRATSGRREIDTQGRLNRCRCCTFTHTASQLTAEHPHPPAATESSESTEHSPLINHKSAPSSVSDSSESLSPAVELAARSIRALADRDTQSPDEDDLVQTMESLHLRGHGKDAFLGKSSGAMLFKKALELKDEYYTAANRTSIDRATRRPEFWAARPLTPSTAQWQTETDADTSEKQSRYSFPPPDLLSELVDLYFAHSAIYYPLLHRPSFQRALADNTHLQDDKFAAIVLCICAIGSRFSDDPRVFDEANPLACGWQFFNQRICLSIQFVEGSAQQGAWTLVGIGIRMAQEMGVHRRQLGKHTLEAELWRRAFWVLVAYDRAVSTGLGRPCATQYCDFDVQMPTECDDEYWEHEDPSQTFRQPPGTPSRMAFFNAYLRLSNVLAFVLHLLYTSAKSNNMCAAADRTWDEQIVKELDSALNKDLTVRWDPRRADPLFFSQSVALYSAYYHTQMMAHRLFIPMVRTVPTTLPSLAICTNAARSCSHVIDVWYQRMRNAPAIILLPAVTTASVMLLLNVWSGKRTGLAPHMNTALAEVQKCMRVVKLFEIRYVFAVWRTLLSRSESFADGRWLVYSGTCSPSWLALDKSRSQLLPPLLSLLRRQRRTNESAHTQPMRDDDSPLTQELEAATVESADPLVLPTGFQDTSFQWSDLGRLPLFPPPPDYAFHPPVPPLGVEYPDWAQLPMPSFFPSSSSAASSANALTQDGMSPEDVFSMIGNDAMTMWSNAPTGLGTGDWSSYFNIMDSLNRETLL
ncbi:Zn(2)-C6 fungal-type domain-containing protein [Mycena sanguinolenta]|uniref:Zn(2)-C6 fungal-type domain-containing protein n=1 Tax=Mycena sanguinolenta TaxID=230812 RepID=A0A8H6YGU1_9AGAR|nr:Zn(2)-C6 fungal-type domain-containing protein [Mycena sanguinolenta]